MGPLISIAVKVLLNKDSVPGGCYTGSPTKIDRSNFALKVQISNISFYLSGVRNRNIFEAPFHTLSTVSKTLYTCTVHVDSRMGHKLYTKY